MKRVFFAVAVMTALLPVNAQENFEVRIQYLSYYGTENQLQHLTTLDIYNSGEETLCIWIEDSLKGTMPTKDLMMKYFYGPTYYESLHAWMNASNVSSSICKIGSTFFKMINPHESFSFVFVGNGDNTEYVRQFADNHLMIYSAKKFSPYNKLNRIEYPLKHIVLYCE